MGEPASMVLNLFRLSSYLVYQSVAVLFRDSSSTRSYSHELRNRVSHALCELMSSKQLRALYKPAQSVIAQKCQEGVVKWKEEDVPDGLGSKIHWVGNTETEKLIVYFHGGGFNLPVDEGHVKFLIGCQRKLADAGQAVNLAVLEYTLTAEARYPTQPMQAMAALQSILHKGFLPSNIVIGGDSAGGNLALTILSLINHPVEPHLASKIDEPFRGTFLISPWVSFSVQSHSWRENAARDLLNARLILEWADVYAPSPVRDEYSEPVRGDVTWWNNLPTRDLLILAGEAEVFRDDIQEIGKIICQSGVSARTVILPNHSHEEYIQDAKAGLAPGLMAESVWEWLVARFE